MKSERRHELEENLLANWLISVFQKIRPYGNLIFGGVILILLVVVVYGWLSRRGMEKAEQAWDAVLTNMAIAREDPGVLERVAEEYSSAEAGQWAALLAAEAYLAKACDALFYNKTEAREYLNDSRKLFERLLQESRNEVIRQRATFGLARADEAAGDLDKAMESWSSPSAKQAGKKADRGYKGLLNVWPNSAYAEVAKDRLEELQRYQIKKFYDDFMRWEPSATSGSAEAGPPSKPAIGSSSQEVPLYTPGKLLSSKPEASSPAGSPTQSSDTAKNSPVLPSKEGKASRSEKTASENPE